MALKATMAIPRVLEMAKGRHSGSFVTSIARMREVKQWSPRREIRALLMGSGSVVVMGRR